MPKLEPAPLRLSFVLTNLEVNGTHYIDLSQCASLVNRRFYRQGLNWAVAGITIQSGASEATGAATGIEKLPATWVVSNAWEKSMAKWRQQQDEAIEQSGSESAVARYRDFKIRFDDAHDFSQNLIPWSGNDAAGLAVNSQFLTGEWQESQIVIPNDGGTPGNTVEYNLHMVGPDGTNSKGMIVGYAQSRAYPQSPDPVSPNVGTSWMAQMFDVGVENDQVLDNATDRNDDVPYPQANYPGGALNAVGPEVVDIMNFTNTTVGARQRSIGATFPCGLIKLTMAGYTTTTNIFVDLVPGNHRGYLCQKMQDM